MKYRRTKKVLVKYAHHPCLQGSYQLGYLFCKSLQIQYEELCSFLVVGTSTIIMVKATPRYPTMTHEAPLPPHDYRTLFTCTATISQWLKGQSKITSTNTCFQFGNQVFGVVDSKQDMLQNKGFLFRSAAIGKIVVLGVFSNKFVGGTQEQFEIIQEGYWSLKCHIWVARSCFYYRYGTSTNQLKET